MTSDRDDALVAALEDSTQMLRCFIGTETDEDGAVKQQIRENTAALAALARRREERRIECASCHRAPTDDPTLILTRVNVKGVPGVFLCDLCDRNHPAATPPPPSRRREEAGLC